MSSRVPTSAEWWATSRSPETTPVGLVAVSGVVLPATDVTVPRRTGGEAGAEPSDTLGAGIDADPVTTLGVAVADAGADTDGAGTDDVAATTEGVAVASVPPPDGRKTVNPNLDTIAPDARWFWAPVAAFELRILYAASACVSHPWFRSAPAGSVYVEGGANVRALPSPSAPANLISIPLLLDGVTVGVWTLLPVPALTLPYTPGRAAPDTQIRIATDDAPACATEYVVGSDPVAVFTNVRPRVYVWPLFMLDASVHPDGVVMSVALPLSVKTARTSTSPETTSEGRAIV
ncbi:hypothetical protein [Nonomuraea wenchangensis]|uniref:Uncharacterized protein n=1 Tax=Nonomuraea wenchangensis TaxID=568860 RepID=A0A1I0EUQ9_9ACTN|nr:hypothetical protein [Nonomuraea wenchangensis]SET49187.1 hypothetical protein SAMN05421811_103210 [Nonomuraea wenchangensis]